ncbi:MAG TPA: type II secretion system protein GspJ [Myxococcota bacterium]|nr:type II secretion system protein GspJ [Myxococcota bacterium]
MGSATRDARTRAGFTLIEVLAVLFLTALLVGTAIGFYIDLSNHSQKATDTTREVRRATTLIDRIALDLERTVLVKKPDDMDPLANPWIFLADSHLGQRFRGTASGSDRIKFMMRADPPRSNEQPMSDLSTVTYTLENSGSGAGFELRRWSSSRMPDHLDRDFPRPDDPASLLLADGVAHFALRFLNDSGEWVDRWDSSQIVDTSELPVQVEIELALVPQISSADPSAAQAAEGEPIVYARRVLLPMRPLDMVALLDPDQLNGGNQNCKLTLADCIDWTKVGGGKIPGMGNPPVSQGAPQMPSADVVQALSDLVANAPNICWDQYRALYRDSPAVKQQCR